MNTKEIEALLEKYYEGNSSLLGEKILREFFLRDDVPAHLKIHQPLFQWAGHEKNRELAPMDLENRLTERFTNYNTSPEIAGKKSNRMKYLYFTGIAASILLLVGVFFTSRKDVVRHSSVKNNLTAELAYIEASEALSIVSSNLNVGLKQAGRLQMLDKGMKNLQMFNKFYLGQSIIINPDGMNNPSPKQK